MRNPKQDYIDSYKYTVFADLECILLTRSDIVR
jgi:hypothetical protein